MYYEALIAAVVIAICIFSVCFCGECLTELCDHTPIEIKPPVSSPIQDNL